MTTRARLIETRVPRAPQGVALVLHGGGSRRDSTIVSPAQLSVLRMVPIAGRLAHAGRGRLAVFRLLNSTRGWDTRHTPVDDVHWALDRLRVRFGEDLPTCLVGHSLGGRAALLSADQPAVRSAVLLAPWVYDTDGDRLDLSGRRILVVHGDQDRIASIRRAEVVASALRRTTDVGFVRVAGGKHSMLRHQHVFDKLAADFAAATLLGERPRGAVARVLEGQPLVEV
jgi:pimeloyl-ACP methyl ester carboxylesterase